MPRRGRCGAPVTELEIVADKPTGLVAVRISDLAPDGAATRVTYGVLNLTHRECHAAPSPLEPGKRYRLRAQLNKIAHHFPAGHRIRLAVSTAYWPIIWPSPEPTALTLFTGASRLVLPVREPRSEDVGLRPLEETETVPPLETTVRPGRIERALNRNIVTGQVGFRIHRDDGRARNGTTGTIIEFEKRHTYRIRDKDPLSAATTSRRITLRKTAGKARSSTAAIVEPVHAKKKTETRPTSHSNARPASGLPCSGMRPVPFGMAVSRNPATTAAP
jgi:predicted acyl esterase